MSRRGVTWAACGMAIVFTLLIGALVVDDMVINNSTGNNSEMRCFECYISESSVGWECGYCTDATKISDINTGGNI